MSRMRGGIVYLSGLGVAGGMPGTWRTLVVPDQAVVARPVTSFQIVKRWCISVRVLRGGERGRRGRKCGVWVPNRSSMSCDVGIFVDQPAEQVAASQVRR